MRGQGKTKRLAAPLLCICLIASASAVIFSLRADAKPSKEGGWRWDLPAAFPAPRVPADNKMTEAKVEIGRRLFFDKRLSGNGTQSCSSCHRPELAFTDGKKTSVGSTGEVHPRNSPSLVNVIYNSTLTWANPGLVDLETQMAVPLFSTEPVELGITDATRPVVLKRIRKDLWYKKRFAEAFPREHTAVTFKTIVNSIAAFQRSLISADSRYDRFLRKQVKLTQPERRGMELFMGERAECFHCHGSFIFNNQVSYVGDPGEQPLFQNNGIYNIGGTGAYPAPNRGVFEFTANPKDMGTFKAPSLRNVELTAPYMHDGSFATLEEVVAQYARGGRLIESGPHAGDGSKSPFRDPQLARIDLSKRDQRDLVAFLKTLTDPRVAEAKAFSDPFERRVKKRRSGRTG